MAIRSIAVVGATGMLGQPVATALVAAGYRVTLLARDPDRAAAVVTGAAVCRADVFDPDSLRRALPGHDGLYLNLNLPQSARERDRLTEREGLGNVLAAARASGVQRVAMISSLVMNYQGTNGFDWWVFRLKQAAVAAVKGCGLAWTVFYPSTFMENFRYTQRRGNSILLAGRSRHPMWYIAGADYGRQVAAAFAGDHGAGRDYPVQGPEAWTADQAARIYAQNAPRRLHLLRAPLAALRLGALAAPSLRYGWRIVHALNEYPERFAAQDTWAALGRPTLTLAEFARRNG